MNRVVARLREHGIRYLITIGGDDTALSARLIVEASGGSIGCVHVPKTIDNDLPLPLGTPTFGFSTARYHGTQIVKNLMQDSLTTGRWYIVTVMGRSAGWLALAIGRSASATVTLIPEEFGEKISLQCVADVIEGAMIKRQSMGRPDGVAVVAEGLAYRLGDREELANLLDREIPVDAAGHIRLSEVPLGYLLRRELEQRYAARNDRIGIVSHVLGYELRSADPTPADMSYCRSLGYGAVRLILERPEQAAQGVMATLVNENLVPMPFADMIDPVTNRTRIRMVDVNSDEYRVARAYMIRLEKSDMEDEQALARLAQAAKMAPDDFRRRYGIAARLRVQDSPLRAD